jgi:hypothetical protein
MMTQDSKFLTGSRMLLNFEIGSVDHPYCRLSTVHPHRPIDLPSLKHANYLNIYKNEIHTHLFHDASLSFRKSGIPPELIVDEFHLDLDPSLRLLSIWWGCLLRLPLCCRIVIIIIVVVRTAIAVAIMIGCIVVVIIVIVMSMMVVAVIHGGTILLRSPTSIRRIEQVTEFR